MNYFRFYPGDYQRDTADLSLAEHGAYLLMLCAYYSSGSLPAKSEALYRIASAMTDDERAAVDSVTERFFPLADDGRRHNPRADREVAARAEQVEAARANGKRGGRPRKTEEKTHWVSQEKPTGLGLGSISLTQAKPNGKASHSQSSSVPKGTDREDPVAMIFSAGVDLLTGGGCTDRAARSFLGGLRKQATDAEVAAAIIEARQKAVSEPRAWLHARIVGKKRGFVC